MKILIVDDSKLIQKMVGGMLTDLGHTSEGAENGKIALEKITSGNSYDLILLDWNMPELNGPGFLDAVKAQNLNPCPIVMMTTENSMEHIQLALSKGASEYIMKPFTPDILDEKIKYVIQEAA